MVEFGKALPVEQQQEINGVLNDAEETLISDDDAVLHDSVTKVEEATIKLSEALMAVA